MHKVPTVNHSSIISLYNLTRVNPTESEHSDLGHIYTITILFDDFLVVFIQIINEFDTKKNTVDYSWVIGEGIYS
jgi:hypothetical protein